LKQLCARNDYMVFHQEVLRQVSPVLELGLKPKPDCQGIHRQHAGGRTPCGCVDWNCTIVSASRFLPVVPRVRAQFQRNRLRGAPEAAQRHFVGEEIFLLIDW